MQMPLYPGPRLEMAVERSAAALASLVEASRGLVTETPEDVARAAAERGFFRPLEEDRLVLWFARFLTVRNSLWEVLSDLIAARDGDIEGFFDLDVSPRDIDEDERTLRWQAFLLGYGASCALVHLDRFVLEDLATEPLIQRKLNQGFDDLRIPRKVFTSIFESFTDPSSALIFDQAIRVRRRHAEKVEASQGDPLLGPVLEDLPWLESVLDTSRRRFFRLFVRYQTHALRRRWATIREHGLFSVLESSGRFASEIRDHWRTPRLSAPVLERLSALLRPGDVLVTRHENALTNLFLPGFWPHAALYVGTESDRRHLGVELDKRREKLWSGPRRVLEALKDGVRFRVLEETLSVDAVAVIRPVLTESALAEGLTRAARHEGKGYNFDFDFFRSDRLVCTEVIYRAYDGLENLELPLSERAGRPTLAAEDLLDLALDTPTFEVVAVFGVPDQPETLFLGEEATEALRQSYRVAPG